MAVSESHLAYAVLPSVQPDQAERSGIQILGGRHRGHDETDQDAEG